MTNGATQLDLLGRTSRPQMQVRKGGTATMQQLHGVSERYQCGDCAHLVKMNHGRTVYKCLKWKFTPDSRTDISADQAACGKYRKY